MIRELAVGALLQPLSVSGKAVSLEPLPNYAQVVDAIRSDRQFGGGLVYPRVREDQLKSEQGRCRGEMVQVPEDWFSFGPTHRLVWIRPVGQEHAAYTTFAVGFLLGIRLIPESWGHLGRAAVVEGKWSDFVISWSREGVMLLDTIEESWHMRQRDRSYQSLYAAINAYQLSFTYDHDYERLVFLNMALDRVHAALQRQGPDVRPGVDRVVAEVFAHLGLSRTRWFVKRKRRGERRQTSVHAITRNKLLHWAVLSEKAVGFAVVDDSYMLQLENLVARGIVAALGIRCKYTSSRIGTRNTYALDCY